MDSNGDTVEEPGRGAGAGTPRWVKVFGIIAVLVVLLFVALLLTRGPHRPGRHTGDDDGQTPPSSVTERAVQQS